MQIRHSVTANWIQSQFRPFFFGIFNGQDKLHSDRAVVDNAKYPPGAKDRLKDSSKVI